ncbi:FAD:protein FMN transferase [Pseudomonas asplenii]|uniref:FAD:protein FMN transferase n=1 Tax=Pseudomonas asplenii TaxID=53407 RepID=UPI00037A935C
MRLSGQWLAGLLLVLLSGCGDQDPLERFGGPTMGSSYSVQYVRHAGGPAPALVKDEVEAILAGVDRQMSTYRGDSDIARFNELPANRCQVMPASILELVRTGEALSVASGGAYDLTVEPLMNLWGFGPQGRAEKVPDAAQLAAVRQRVGHAHLHVDGERLCKDAAVQVDFDSIAAGYTVERISTRLMQMGVDSFLVQVTGELKAVGRKPDGSPWRIALEEPRDDRRVAQRIIDIDGYGVSTSGDYRNYFEQDGKRYSHTFDALTGAPISHDLAAVTVVHPSTLMADGLSTVLLILGPERGWDYAEKHDIAAFFVIRADKAFVTRANLAFDRLLKATAH